MYDQRHSEFTIENPINNGMKNTEMVKMGGSSNANIRLDENGEMVEVLDLDEHGNPIELANNSKYLTMFLLLNTMIGSGILNQPFVFKESGILGGIGGFIIATWATWTSLNIITDVGISVNILEYSGLAKKAYDKLGIVMVDVFIIINSFGALLGYILIVGETMSELLKEWGCEKAVCEMTGITSLFVTFLVLPICLFRHFGHLSIMSVFSICTIGLVLCLVTIGGPIRTRHDHVGESVRFFHGLGSLRSIGSIIFALGCLPANFQAFVAADKQSRSLESWQYITLRTVVTGACMCATMGIAGYLSFREGVKGNILENFVGGDFDFFKFMVVLHLIAYIPVDFVVMRYSIVKVALDKKSETLGLFSHVTLTIVLLAITTIFILVMIDEGMAAGEAFSLTLNLTGGVGGSCTGFIMPSLIYLKLMPKDSRYYTTSKYLLCAGVTFMILVITSTIISFQEKKAQR